MKILIADDTQVDLKILSTYLRKSGFLVIEARNGVEAVDLFISEAPDLVLLDVIMPIMDGYEATRKIKAQNVNEWIPVILLTGLKDDKDLVNGISSGADDYLIKPINFTILGEKIKVMRRIRDMQRQMNENLKELEIYHRNAEEEHSLAKQVIDNFVRFNHINKGLFKYWIHPAKFFSGDVIAAGSSPSGNILYLLLADGTGHGLSASLCVMPVVDIFYGMTARGFSVSNIIEKINSNLHRSIPTGHFVAAALTAIHWDSQTIELWNGGLPPPFFMNKAGYPLRFWNSNHPPLGILGKEEFDAETELYCWNEPGQLYICSDGLLEAKNSAGEEFGAERLIQNLSEVSPHERFERLKAEVGRYRENSLNADDISVIEVQCELRSTHQAAENEPLSFRERTIPGRLKLDLSLSAILIKTMDVLSFLLNGVDQMGFDPSHRERICFIMKELYNNALDHGLLNLDSAIKQLPDGYEQYIHLRELRLSELAQGKIEMGIEKDVLDGAEILKIKIKDSGKGFDYHSHLNHDPLSEERFFGRGINLVRSLSYKLEYQGRGNEAIVYYRFN